MSRGVVMKHLRSLSLFGKIIAATKMNNMTMEEQHFEDV